MNTETKIDKLFIDVRNAFRLLKEYQEKVLSIVYFIKEKTRCADIINGEKKYSCPISMNANCYNNLSKDMWGWDFLYGYQFQYNLGSFEDESRIVQMSILQVSDDGPYLSHSDKGGKWIDVSSFASSVESHSYLVFYVIISPKGGTSNFLLNDDSFMEEYLSSNNPQKVLLNEELKELQILNRYELQRFASLESTEEVIRKFGKIVLEQAQIKLFKDDYYGGL